MSELKPTEPAIWVIWSNEHGAYWRPKSAGYTTKIEDAGRYPRSEAETICRVHLERLYSRSGVPAEIMLIAPEVEPRLALADELASLCQSAIYHLRDVEIAVKMTDAIRAALTKWDALKEKGDV